MVGRLKGKVALITGAGSNGIGRASAILFAKEGASVAISDINLAGAEETHRLVRESGGRSIFLEMDVTKSSSVQQAVEQTMKELGPINVLYNNAGGSMEADGLVHTISEETWHKTHSVDLFGTFLCCKIVITEMMKSGGGAIINTSSFAALFGTKRTAYCAAKGGVVSLTRSIAACYAKDNIRANVICPAVTLTGRIEQSIERHPEHMAWLLNQQPLGALEPIDAANAALYLASDESRKITGVVFPVDSGASV